MARAIGIRIFRGADLVESQIFERDIIKIGRLASAHLRLEDAKISRIHAVINVTNGDEVSIIDMGSVEGTRVNGEKVSRASLKHSDEVALGDSRLVLVLDEAEIDALRASGASSEGAAVSGPAAAVGGDDAEPLLPGGGFPIDDHGPTDPSAQTATTRENSATQARPTSVPGPLFVTKQEIALGDFPAPPVVMESSAPIARAARAPSQPPVPPAAPPQGAGLAQPASTPAPAPRAAPLIVPMPLFDLAPLPPIPQDAITSENRFVEVAVRWGNDVVECRRFRNVPRVVVGNVVGDARRDERAPTMFVPLEGAVNAASFDLLRSSQGGGWVVRFTKAMTGTIRRGEASVPLAQAGGTPDGDAIALPLTDDSQVILGIGSMQVEVTVVPRSRFVPIAPIFDVLWANTAVISMFATTAILAVLTLMPVGLDSMEDDLLTNPSKFQTLILKPPPKDNSFLNKLKGPKKQMAAAGKEKGKAGDKKKTEDTGARMAVKAREKPTDEQVVASKLDALFGDKSNGGIAQLFGDTTGGGALEAALGGIDGAKIGASAGVGGLGLRGSGPGGGGEGLATLGTGKVGTRGRGSGDAGYGASDGGLGGKTDREATFTQGTPVVYGSLDREIIGRIVREHASQIRYCYERELTRTPGLQGKVPMKWIINGDGRVTQAQAEGSQLNNPNVESCLATKIKTWVFPKPKGGGIVIVTYPFVFKQSG